MVQKRYKKSIILLALYFIVPAVLIFIGFFTGIIEFGNLPISSFIPAPDSLTEGFLILFVLWPVAALIGLLLGQYLFLPLYMIIQTKIIGFNFDYGIQEKPKSSKMRKKSDLIYPGLIAVNIAVFLTNIDALGPLLLHPRNFTDGFTGFTRFNLFFILTIFSILISVCLYAPIWMFLDSGIVFSNKERVKDYKEPVVIRSVGGFYRTFLKSFAGIGAIFAFLQLYTTTLAMEYSSTPVSLMYVSGILIFLPLLMSISMLTATLLLDKTQESKIKYTRKLAKKFGINDYVEVSIEKVEKAPKS